MKLSEMLKKTHIINKKMRDLRRIDKALDKRKKLAYKYQINETYIELLVKAYNKKYVERI